VNSIRLRGRHRGDAENGLQFFFQAYDTLFQIRSFAKLRRCKLRQFHAGRIRKVLWESKRNPFIGQGAEFGPAEPWNLDWRDEGRRLGKLGG
jgi:hypothetical protein